MMSICSKIVGGSLELVDTLIVISVCHFRMDLSQTSQINLCGFYNSSCGYCHSGEDSSASYGFKCEFMMSEDYKGCQFIPHLTI